MALAILYFFSLSRFLFMHFYSCTTNQKRHFTRPAPTDNIADWSKTFVLYGKHGY